MHIKNPINLFTDTVPESCVNVQKVMIKPFKSRLLNI